MNTAALFLLTLFLFSCTSGRQAETSSSSGLAGVVSSSQRARENRERDEHQHPLETLAFFGIRPDMTVVEIAPGAGYYTEILVPYLGESGQYYMAVPRMPSRPPTFMVENERQLQAILLEHKDVVNKPKFMPFEPRDKRNRIRPDFADMVVSFNSVHNWVAEKSAPEAFKLFYDILKPGGILGLTQHRIAEGKKRVPRSGYMTEKEVISLAEKAGFKLTARSEINANPRDTADYPEGVWTLPPYYRLGDKDRDRYEDIGESDRMTLKFVKVTRKK